MGACSPLLTPKLQRILKPLIGKAGRWKETGIWNDSHTPTLRGLPKPHKPGPCFRPQPPDVGVPATWNDSHSGDVGAHAKSEPGHPAHLAHHRPRGEITFRLFRG